MLRILHLSDIHFCTPDCLDRRMDRDWSVRELIVSDAKKIVDQTGEPINAILVSGDITQKADPEEFEVAKEWLQETARTLGANIDSIFIVPGNHDIDRNVCSEPLVQAIRNSILEQKNEKRVEKFLHCLRDVEAAKFLMRPLAEYNRFAVNFACDIWPPDRTFWTHAIPLNDRYKLNLNGLTSVFFSSKEDMRANLYMGSFQTNLEIRPGIINLVMFHHPVGWLEDGDVIEDDIKNRSAIRLIGHKHLQREACDGYGVTFAAGAVNPSRHEGNWNPGYNIIDISVREEDNKAFLDVQAHLRRYQDAPECFISIQSPTEKEYFNYIIPIPLAPIIPIENEDKSEADNVMETDTEQKKRKVSIRFWNLTSSQRRRIIYELDLLTEEELVLPDIERYHRAFEVARERSIIDQLVNLIEREET